MHAYMYLSICSGDSFISRITEIVVGKTTEYDPGYRLVLYSRLLVDLLTSDGGVVTETQVSIYFPFGWTALRIGQAVGLDKRIFCRTYAHTISSCEAIALLCMFCMFTAMY